MVDFNVFREECMFNVDEYDFLILEKYLRILREYPHLLQSSPSGSLDKLYFFQDVWFLIQYGKQYKVAVTEKDVTLKEVRLLFLEYLATMDEVEAAKTLCAQERFIFCYRYLTELFHYLRQRAREEATLHGIREDCYGAIDQKNANIVLEPKSIKRYYNDWFKQGYILSKLFQEKLAEVKKVCLAMHDVCGLRINNRDENTVHFIQAVLKADDLLEIAFWKRKFIEQGVSTIFKHNGEKTLPTIVVCVQQSDAMRSLLNMHIGLICAILVISENERRDFVCIPYAEQVAKESFSEKGQFTIAQYMEIVQQFLGGDGAPNYRQLLNTAFTMLKLSATSSSGEIVLICDDQIGAHVPQDEAWQKAVQKYKKDMNIRVIVLYSGNFNPEMSIWFADRVMFIEDFQSKIEVM